LQSSADDLLDDVFKTLTVLDDYRVLAPLTKVMEDFDTPAYLRTGASEILSGCTTSESATTRRSWWNSQDPILMRHAILVAERSEMDIIEEIAKDPQHEFYIDAIEKISHWFEEPRFQEYKIIALSDLRADVRRSAAWAIYWDQPIAAENDLLRLAQEDDDYVADEALSGLAYYGSQNNLVALHELMQNGPEARRERYAEIFENVRDDFLSATKTLQAKSAAAAEYFKTWLKPVWEILAFSDAELLPEQNGDANARDSKPERSRPTVEHIVQHFDNADGLWVERWAYARSIDWTRYSDEQRLILIDYFSHHKDWSVRELSCSILGELKAADALFALLQDEVFAVRKSAAYEVRELPQQNRIAKRLWDMISVEQIQGMHAIESLESYVIHSTEQDLDDRLRGLAEANQRESVKNAAIWQLEERESRKHLESLIPTLDQKPLVTWAAHRSLLSACVNLHIPVKDLARFAGIDDLYLQQTLAEALALRDKSEAWR
jgi:HEAT repeat protein